MNIKTEEIIFGSSKGKDIGPGCKNVCEIFRFQPDNMEQVALGNLYIIAELNSVKDCTHLGNLLAALIKREYYLNPQRGITKSFDSALRKANLYLKDLSDQGNSEWLGKLHFICAVISGNELFFAQAGAPKAFLCRQAHLTDLAHKIIPEPEKQTPAKIFSSVVSGKIEAGDKIIFATPFIEKLFSFAGLRQIVINNRGIQTISDQINKVLREEKKILRIAILLLEAEEEKIIEELPPPKDPKKFITPPLSLDEIIN